MRKIFSNLQANNPITDNESSFEPGDSSTNQLVFLVNEIHECFEDKRSIDLRAVFLDISKAFDKVSLKEEKGKRDIRYRPKKVEGYG